MNTVNDWSGISFNSRDPVYSQVVRLFKEKIVTGVIQSGQTIPSRRELAAMLKINPNTAQRAYKEMEDQRLIITEGNSPSRVTLELDVLRQIRAELLGTAVEAFVASIRNIDVPLDELLNVVQQKYTEAQTEISQNPRETPLMMEEEERILIELMHVSQRYRIREVLKDVTFTAEKGQITCLIGVNGAGKSTVLKTVMGLTPIQGEAFRLMASRLARILMNRYPISRTIWLFQLP